MLQLDILIKKTEITNSKTLPGVSIGEKVIDFTIQTFSFANGDVPIKKMGMVTMDLEMRPDLVARIYYGNINKMDRLCKYNGISNPFSLQAGQVVLIGDADQLDACITAGTSNANTAEKQEDIRLRFFDPNQLSTKDAARLALLQKKSQTFSNAANNLPPNFAAMGAQEITVQNGVVMFGGTAVANTSNCSGPISRAVVQAKLIANKVFNVSSTTVNNSTTNIIQTNVNQA